MRSGEILFLTLLLGTFVTFSVMVARPSSLVSRMSGMVIVPVYFPWKLAGRLVHVVDEKTEKEIRRHEWRKVLETSDSNEDFGAKLEATCFGKKPLMILANTDWNGLAGTLGLFAPEGFIESGSETR